MMKHEKIVEGNRNSNPGLYCRSNMLTTAYAKNLIMLLLSVSRQYIPISKFLFEVWI